VTPFNGLSDADKAKLIKGAFGRELLKIVQQTTAALLWGIVPSQAVPRNGSAFFVKTDTAVATFDILPSELTRLERSTVPWPPSIPLVNKSVLIAGFPGAGKTFTESGALNFGLYHSLTSVDSVSDRDISMIRPPDVEMTDIAGKGMPPRGFDMSGMSGGPVISVLETGAGLVSWALAGAIYECGTNFEITKAVRADLIGEDGIIHG
jgi:hypothetical protein